MADSQLDVVSLVSRIEQLEKQQNITAKYAVKVKHQLDELTKQFTDLQECFNQLSNSFTNTDSTDAPTEPATLDDADVRKQFFERVDQQWQQQSLTAITSEQSGTSIEGFADVEVSAEQVEAEEEFDAAEQQSNLRAFSDEEFKTERMMWLLNRIYAAEQQNQEIPISAEEFLRQYREGKRNFTEVNLAEADLSETILLRVNLSKTNLSRANLRRANLSEAVNLSEVNLSGAYLTGANLRKANLMKADLSNADLSSANLLGATLSGANLSGAYLYGVNLSGANLTSADLRGVNFTHANLEKANLKDSNMSGAILEGANLSGTIMPDGKTKES